MQGGEHTVPPEGADTRPAQPKTKSRLAQLSGRLRQGMHHILTRAKHDPEGAMEMLSETETPPEEQPDDAQQTKEATITPEQGRQREDIQKDLDGLAQEKSNNRQGMYAVYDDMRDAGVPDNVTARMQQEFLALYNLDVFATRGDGSWREPMTEPGRQQWREAWEIFVAEHEQYRTLLEAARENAMQEVRLEGREYDLQVELTPYLKEDYHEGITAIFQRFDTAQLSAKLQALSLQDANMVHFHISRYMELAAKYYRGGLYPNQLQGDLDQLQYTMQGLEEFGLLRSAEDALTQQQVIPPSEHALTSREFSQTELHYMDVGLMLFRIYSDREPKSQEEMRSYPELGRIMDKYAEAKSLEEVDDESLAPEARQAFDLFRFATNGMLQRMERMYDSEVQPSLDFYSDLGESPEIVVTASEVRDYIATYGPILKGLRRISAKSEPDPYYREMHKDIDLGGIYIVNPVNEQEGPVVEVYAPIATDDPEMRAETDNVFFYILDHELGHHMHNNILPMQQLGRYAQVLDEEEADITGYSRYSRERTDNDFENRIIHAREDFAESWAMFRLEPERLQAIAPERYRFFLDFATETFGENVREDIVRQTEENVLEFLQNYQLTPEGTSLESMSPEQRREIARQPFVDIHTTRVEDDYQILHANAQQNRGETT